MRKRRPSRQTSPHKRSSLRQAERRHLEGIPLVRRRVRRGGSNRSLCSTRRSERHRLSSISQRRPQSEEIMGKRHHPKRQPMGSSEVETRPQGNQNSLSQK